MSRDGISQLQSMSSTKEATIGESRYFSNFHLWSFFNRCRTYWSMTLFAPFDVRMSATRSLVDTWSRTISKMSAWQSSRKHRPSCGGGRWGGRLRPWGSSCLSSISSSFSSTTCWLGFAAILFDTPPIDNSVSRWRKIFSLSFPFVCGPSLVRTSTNTTYVIFAYVEAINIQQIQHFLTATESHLTRIALQTTRRMTQWLAFCAMF